METVNSLFFRLLIVMVLSLGDYVTFSLELHILKTSLVFGPALYRDLVRSNLKASLSLIVLPFFQCHVIALINLRRGSRRLILISCLSFSVSSALLLFNL